VDADDAQAIVRVLLGEHEACRKHLKATAVELARGVTGETTGAAIRQVRSLLEFLEGGLETHIAKEEGPLSPRLKAALPGDDRLIDEMVAEHDLVRMKRDDVRAVLDGLTASHDDVRQARGELRGALGRPSTTALKEAVGTVAEKLRVHFENEEDLVFPLVADLLSSDDQAQVVQEMAAIEATG